METFLQRIYGSSFNSSTDIEPSAWREVLRIMNEAAVNGITQSRTSTAIIDRKTAFLNSIKHSNEVFSAFKVHTMAKQMAGMLHDEKGNLKPFNQWRQDIDSIASHHTNAWLRTEYNTAVIRAHRAADWQEFIDNADVMPNLRWMPTTSPNPENSHAVYWRNKLTLPVGDAFWNSHHPGDRWNCNCSLQQTDEPVNPLPHNEEPTTPHRGLDNNPGKDGHIFNDTHPYFPKNCNACPFNSGIKNKLLNVFNNQKKDCFNCQKINNSIPNAEGFIVKNKYPNGGELQIHPLVDKSKPDYNAIVNIGQHFAKTGRTVKITPSVHFKSEEYRNIYGSLIGTKYERKCPDLSVDGIFYEYEGFVKPWSKNKVKAMLSHGLKQSPYLVIDNTKGCSDRFIRKAIMARVNLHGQNIEEVWIYEKGKTRLFYKKE